MFGLAPDTLSPGKLCAKLKKRRVLAAPFRGGVRFVTHRDVSDAECAAAAAAVAVCLTEGKDAPDAGQKGDGGMYGQGPAWPG